MMGRKGPVLQDRYHAHVLRTPAEVRNALRYVLGNFESHAERRGEPRSTKGWVESVLVRGGKGTPRGAAELVPGASDVRRGRGGCSASPHAPLDRSPPPPCPRPVVDHMRRFKRRPG